MSSVEKGIMELSKETCILINTCEKYKELALAQIKLIRRYATKLRYPIYLATNGLTDEDRVFLAEMSIEVIEQSDRENEDFIGSRIHALLTIHTLFVNVIMLQDDFLLDREPNYEQLAEAEDILRKDSYVCGIRFMPCPGPTGPAYKSPSGSLQTVAEINVNDPYFYSYQAGIWRSLFIYQFFMKCAEDTEGMLCGMDCKERNRFWIRVNPCETDFGTKKMLEILPPKAKLLGFVRKGKQSNGVYLSPWPYRPTAVEKGVLQGWAFDLLDREGIKRPIAFL